MKLRIVANYSRRVVMLKAIIGLAYRPAVDYEMWIA